jgi:hypothetical protein
LAREHDIEGAAEVTTRHRNLRLWATVVELATVDQSMVTVVEVYVWSALRVEASRNFLRCIEEIRK